MKVLVAKTAGFCFGVRRAVELCEKAASEHHHCATIGPIIHNKYVVDDLREKGVHVISDASEAKPNSTVIIRSHGAAKVEYEELASRNVNVIDATCPDVKKIHKIVIKESKDNRKIIIIGEKQHPEVKAIAGWSGEYEIFESPDELNQWLNSGNNAHLPLSVVFQSTATKKNFNSCDKILKKLCTNYKTFDTMCSATLKRQHEAAQLAKVADMTIVIGGRNSANTLRLESICREHCPKVVFVENADELKHHDSVECIAIIAGASTPAWIIKEVTQKMSEEIKQEGTLTEEMSQESAVASEEIIADEIIPEEVISEEIIPEEVTLEEIITEEVASEEVALEEIITDEVTSKEIVSEEVIAEEVASEEIAPDEVVSEGVVSEDIVSQDTEIVPEVQPVTDDSLISEHMVTPEPISMSEESESSVSPEVSEDVTETFEDMLEKSIKTLHTGERVVGVITSITATEVSVELGTKQSGYIPITEFTDDSNANIEDIIKIGDSIEAFVLRVNDVEGMVTLSKKRLDAIKNWNQIETAKDSKEIVEGMVVEDNKGGIVVNVKGVRVFVPASQTGLPKSAPMSELLKKKVKLRIIEVNQSRRRVLGSIRAVQVEERRAKTDAVWNEIEVGKVYNGTVKSMTSYGVFVDIGGVDGMIHISELSWSRIKTPSEVVSVGDEISVHILSFDKDNRKISLGYRKSEDNPWIKFTSQFAVGDITNVKIVKMMPFGAFAEICPGVDGLIHISQIADHRIGSPSEVLSDGQLVDVKITDIDNDRKKVSLSIRALIEPEQKPTAPENAEADEESDNTPVVVYDTDAPPEFVDDDEEQTTEAVEEPVEIPEVTTEESVEEPVEVPETAPEAVEEPVEVPEIVAEEFVEEPVEASVEITETIAEETEATNE
jgi:(E)-4-hydroxy-3-methyl-but-2-enyl pyrophosphate reductase